MVQSWTYFQSEENIIKMIIIKQNQNKQVGLYQMEKLMHSKQNYPQNEDVMGIVGSICKSYLW